MTPRVAVVTGAARGIGAAVVRRLAGEGWRVVAVDICEDIPGLGYSLASKEELLSLVREFPDTVREVVADVRDAGALVEAAEIAQREFGGLDAAVAAAAVIAGGHPLWESDDEEWQLQLDIGVSGVANLARAAIPVMLRSAQPRSGRFVALASAAAHRGLWHAAGYNATKHAVVGLIRGLAHDLRGTGITATAVSPGSTRTSLLDASAALYDLADVEEFSRYHLTEQLLRPEEVADVVSFLCGKGASSITGTVVHADGGFTA
ncbi:mycofactocin-coupled SDR family oxidoreductase [Kutzneria sp. 744]|uniref:mycofactocin-coupled SDR family oxidoreductase n=1 Tax=Kutzneria sp. (strain 744) TaxID=345341 RepID=UPI0003EEB585|nr:mycofactocin-coupled SDR family oxidoreductase [Kutzneria sp. 744]EWM17484.1 (+)-trans-carveol dehydrogenase [Kutzneria sp. 744]